MLARLHYALNDSGFPFLGRAEMLLTHSNLFLPLDMRHRVFVKVPPANPRDRLLVLADVPDREPGSEAEREWRLGELARDTGAGAPPTDDAPGTQGVVSTAAAEVVRVSERE